MTQPDEPNSNRISRMSELLGGFAHEIKNPLSTIGLNLRLLEEDLGDCEGPRHERNLQRTRRLSKEVGRLQGILEDFLAYARAPGPRLREISLNELVREVVDLSAPGIEQDGIHLGLYLQEGLPPLLADPNLLHQVLLNLLTNAQQAQNHAGIKGEILVRTGWEPGTQPGESDETAGRHLLSVQDNGPGMSEKALAQCFEPYYSTKKEGTGLGLAITKRFVEDHGGSIMVESHEGTGTRFQVWLPSRGKPKDTDGDS